MLSKTTILRLAREAVVSAHNDDWRGRGCLTLEGKIKKQSIFAYADNEGYIGDATIAFLKFKRPLVRTVNHPFIGFTLAAIKKGKKIIYETKPVIGSLKSNDWEFINLAARFCPQCLSLDSVTTRERQVAPECIEITYKCKKCSYEEYDVMD